MVASIRFPLLLVPFLVAAGAAGCAPGGGGGKTPAPSASSTASTGTTSFTSPVDVTIDLGPQNAGMQNASYAAGSQRVNLLQLVVTPHGGDVDLLGFGFCVLASGGLDPAADVTALEVVDAAGRVVFGSGLLDGEPPSLPTGMSLAVDGYAPPSGRAVAHVADGATATFTVRVSFGSHVPAGAQLRVDFDSIYTLRALDAQGAGCDLLPGPGLQHPSNGTFETVSSVHSGNGTTYGYASSGIITLDNPTDSFSVFDYANY
jgi:hypothetical protein